ncbi:MAG: long-chain fatty acid--CoA ligase [Chloroflexi bacterium]|nr:long-chain fatty acid--CoA ligase [Chloroflexota bacterium]
MNTIASLLEESAARYGERTALVMRQGYRTQRWSYERLWRTSGQVAGRLQRQGVQKGDRIILWGINSPEWVAAFFGCLRAGAIAVPLDARSTREFTCQVAQRTQPTLAFVSAVTMTEAQALGVPLAVMEKLEAFVGDGPVPEGLPALGPEDIAEVMFTSGTTGDPKGVVLTHGNIASNVEAATTVVPVKPDYRLLSLLPLSHMLEQTVGLLSPLSGGAAVHYLPSRQPAVIFRAFKEYRITSLVLVPQALQLFMNAMHARAEEQGKGKLSRNCWQRPQTFPFQCGACCSAGFTSSLAAPCTL